MHKELENLCSFAGISGREEKVRAYIISQIDGLAEYKSDALGNLIVFKKGAVTPKNKVMLAAHMDEVGLIVTYITDDGYLKFTSVGGIDSRVMLGRMVIVGERNTPGVIGVKPTHMLNDDEKANIPDDDSLYIDIGASNRDEASQYVRLGDVVCFDSDFIYFGEDLVKARALDDRAGCSTLIEIIKSDLPYDLNFVFTVQEEVGLRGAKAASFAVAPDYAIVVETTTAADISGVPKEKQVCQLGEGAVISFMDRSTVYSRDLYDLAFALAEKNDIKVQPKTVVSGGNDAGAIHSSRAGVKTLTVSLPCRYLHSPSCVICEKDIAEVLKIVFALAEEFANA
ncbi:MAG: M42 family metallopeptidase [Eubacteriales bacterium]